MRKIALITALTLTVLTGCSGHDVEPEQSSVANKYIDLVVIYENLSQQTEVMYDKNTGVMYFHRDSRYDSFITPIYNSDGTLKLYEEK